MNRRTNDGLANWGVWQSHGLAGFRSRHPSLRAGDNVSDNAVFRGEGRGNAGKQLQGVGGVGSNNARVHLIQFQGPIPRIRAIPRAPWAPPPSNTCAQHNGASTTTWSRPSRTAAVHARTQRDRTPRRTCAPSGLCCRVGLLHRLNPCSPSSQSWFPIVPSSSPRPNPSHTRATPAPTNCMSMLGPLLPVNQRLVSRVSRSTTDLAGVILRRLPWGSRPHNQQHPGRAEGASVAAEEARSRFVCRRGANESHTQPSTHPTHHTPVSRAPSRHPPDHIVPFCVAPSKGVSSVGPLEQGQNVSSDRSTQHTAGVIAWSFMGQRPIGDARRPPK